MGDEINLVEKSRIMDGSRMKRALSRLASEIVEENHGAKDLYLVGIRRRGVPLAERLAEKIEVLEGTRPLYGILDITLYRDDLSTVGAKKVQLAVLIDRGREHRELPIQADFIGKVVPTKQTEIIKVMLKEFDDIEAVGIFERP
jgi:pyrimidine operon attenuation protein/uracil phosphoribosyltransferase